MFNASKTLLQFNVIDWRFKQLEDGARLHLDIKLRRIVSYHLTNTYMPTMTLLIISIVTLQFDESKTEMSVGLSLTIMLVMYTLYQSISASLIKTAYLKMIDYWLLFCLLLPFAIFMIEIYWMMLLTNKQTQSGWVKEEKKKNDHRRNIQYLTYIFSCLFAVLYFVIAVFMHFEII